MADILTSAATEQMGDEIGHIIAVWLRAMETIRGLKQERDRLREALIWTTGSNDFAPGGQAHAGFLKVVSPLLRSSDSAIAGER